MPPIEPPIYYFYLSTKVTVFEPMGPLNSVYYDDAGKHIFTLRSRGTMGVNVKSVVNDVALNFRIDDRGEILSIKFSEDNEILGIQRSLQSVDFLNFKNHCPNGVQYSQTCRNKSASLLGFVWCSNHEVLFVSNEQLELYQVLAEKNTVRLNKCLPLNTNWFLWNVDTRICLTFGSEESLHVFNLKTSGTISKGPKFQLSETKDMNGVATSLEHRHSFLALLYGNLYFCTLRYLSLNNNRRLTRTVCFYSLDMENPVSLTHVVLLDSEDCVSFSVLDDLFMVHYQNKKVSSVYDIALMGTMHNNVNTTNQFCVTC
ncbi:unnamed protein product [Heterobilharzia americana]|nr:unnamed protein product [Heterobilharzia americana]